MALCFFWKLKSIYFILLSFVLVTFNTRCSSPSCIVIFCYSLSIVIICCRLLYHSLLLVVPLVVIRCTTCFHSLSFVVPLIAPFVVSLVIKSFEMALNLEHRTEITKTKKENRTISKSRHRHWHWYWHCKNFIFILRICFWKKNRISCPINFDIFPVQWYLLFLMLGCSFFLLLKYACGEKVLIYV